MMAVMAVTGSGSSPHTRGAPLRDRRGARDVGGSSPHTRGARRVGPVVLPRRGIIPAYAGSTDAHVGSDATYPDHPRIRGEHSPTTPPGRRRNGSSPHTRGARVAARECLPRLGIIPAYAGSTGMDLRPAVTTADHPRIRGEHGDRGGEDGLYAGSSPHTRGARPPRPGKTPASGIIPAYAGSTEDVNAFQLGLRDHPRIRGEHFWVWLIWEASWGSSPHTRGARAFLGEGDMSGRIIPAYAGSTSPWSAPSSRAPDHPRIRGEHVRVAVVGCEAGIIPAYAGSTARGVWVGACRADHPRIRGEHSGFAAIGKCAAGSSPHTRGAPERAGGSSAA